MSARAMAFVRGLVALVLVLAPSVALACPYCAAKDDTTHRTLLFIVTMCLLPFVVGGVALTVIRRMDADTDPQK